MPALQPIAVFAILIVFIAGYLLIALEHKLKINKAAAAILAAVFCWTLYFINSPAAIPEDTAKLNEHLAGVAQIVLFLLGAMTIVELIDSHKGFRIITDFINVTSKRKMLWVIGLTGFFLSAVLDNLTSTIVMVSLLRKIIPDAEDRKIFGAMTVIATNAGGAWTPIGDVTTTMLWINGQISAWGIMQALFIPSIIALAIPLAFQTMKMKGSYPALPSSAHHKAEPKATLVFCLGMGALIFVPIFKALTGLPPFVGILLGLGVLWLVTDLVHYKHDNRAHLRVSHVLTRVDVSGVLFFLGILLAVNALEVAGLLKSFADWLGMHVSSDAGIAVIIGLISAVIDNVPLVAASMGMYDLQLYPMDAPLWEMIAFAAGTGGSILVIGSAAGVAYMGMEKVDFAWYFKRVSLFALLGFFAGLGTYLLLN